MNITFGVEMTGLIHGYEQRKDGSITFKTKTLTWERHNAIVGEAPCHVDGHCIEFNSPIFTSWKEMSLWYRKIKRLFKKYHLTPKNPITVCGGGHLHFNGITLDEKLKVIKDLSERPYIPWIFTQPDDTDSCCNFTSDLIDTNEWWFESTRTAIAKNHNIRTKELAASTSSWTHDNLEFRCVEAPKNLSEFKDQFDFFHRFLLYALQSPHSQLINITNKQLNAITPQECIYNFHLLLDRLNLSRKRYDKYIKRNLLPRWTMGRKRV